MKFHGEVSDCQGYYFIYKICIIEEKKTLMGTDNSVVTTRETGEGWGGGECKSGVNSDGQKPDFGW